MVREARRFGKARRALVGTLGSSLRELAVRRWPGAARRVSDWSGWRRPDSPVDQGRGCLRDVPGPMAPPRARAVDRTTASRIPVVPDTGVRRAGITRWWAGRCPL